MTQHTTRPATASAGARTRALLGCGVVAGPLFVVVVVAQVLTRAGYDLGRHPISMLALGEHGWIQTANFVVSGLLAVACAVGIRRALHPGRGGTWGPVLVAGYGAGLIVAGVFVADPAWGFPPGSADGVPETLSLHAMLHGVGFVLAFGSLTAACLVFARRDAGLGRRGWVGYSVVTAIAALGLSMWPGQEGVSVRYFVAAVLVWAWMSAMAMRLTIRAYRP
jgi:hypothetical membrane protein